jgi:tetratricopeptide (TPR) repeat protein
MMNRLLAVLFFSLFSFASDLVVEINGKSEPVVDKKIRVALDLVYNDRFSEALKVFEGLKKQYPGHPIGYFFTAATLDARMAFYLSNNEEKEFTINCEKAIQLGEASMQSSSDDNWNLFFTGGAYGTLGAYQGRYKRYITSFRNGLSGVDLLKQVYKNDSRFQDALFGVGVYVYWSSKLAKLLWWMPGVGDNREEGIQNLRKASVSGIYATFPAAVNLAQILNLEGRFDEAAKVSQDWLVRYPDNRALSFELGEALIGKGELDRAYLVFEKILNVCDAEERNNNVQALKCHLFLATINEKKRNYVSAMAHSRRGLAYVFKENEMTLAKEHIDALKAIRDRVKSQVGIYR